MSDEFILDLNRHYDVEEFPDKDALLEAAFNATHDGATLMRVAKRLGVPYEELLATVEAGSAARWEADAPARAEAARRKAEAEAEQRAEQERAAEQARVEREARIAALSRQPIIDALALGVVELDRRRYPRSDSAVTLIAEFEGGAWGSVEILCPMPKCGARGSRMWLDDRDGSLRAQCGSSVKADHNGDPIICSTPEQLAAWIVERTEELREELDEEAEDDALDGFEAIFSEPLAEPWWGDEEIGLLASYGQSLAIVGKDSTGKTTLAHQIAKGVMGLPGFENLLGFPLRPLPPGKRVLILVADRPEQVRASFARGIDVKDEEVAGILRDRLVWVTLPGDVLLPSPEGTRWLLDICRARNVGLVIVDSAKDAVDGDLSTPTVGAAYARFRQALIRDGVDVIDLLHPVKTKERIPELSSIAGSGSLYRGVGSVLFLIPQADKTRVQLHQIKPLKETVEPFMVVHDLRSGRSFLEGDARAVGTFDVVRRVIEENGGAAAPALLADALGIHRNRLNRDLKPLIDKGLVTPQGSTRDRRYRLGTDVG